jgi:hypothetical protein
VLRCGELPGKSSPTTAGSFNPTTMWSRLKTGESWLSLRAPHVSQAGLPLCRVIRPARELSSPQRDADLLRVLVRERDAKIVRSPSVLRAGHPNALLPRWDLLARRARRCSPEVVYSPRLRAPHASVNQTIHFFVTIRYLHSHIVLGDQGERTARTRHPTAKKAAGTQLTLLSRLKVWRLTNRHILTAGHRCAGYVAISFCSMV